MTPTISETSNRTVLEALLASIEAVAVCNRSAMVAPAAILWPDEHREWEPLIPLLREVNPYLLTLGPWDATARTGPAIWLKCMIGRTLSAWEWPEDAVPVLYLPGVSRRQLQAVENCPKHLQPLAELQYRAVFWTQQNTRDWTILAFLKSNGGGLALDVAQDSATPSTAISSARIWCVRSAGSTRSPRTSSSSCWAGTARASIPTRSARASRSSNVSSPPERSKRASTNCSRPARVSRARSKASTR